MTASLCYWLRYKKRVKRKKNEKASPQKMLVSVTMQHLREAVIRVIHSVWFFLVFVLHCYALC